MTLTAFGSSRIWRPEPGWQLGVLLVLPLVAVLGLFVFYPVIRLLQIAMPDGIGVQSFVDYFSNGARLRALLVTFRDSAVVSILAAAMGFILAWSLVSSTSRALKATIWIAVALPMLMGTVVKNYALLILLARRGILNSLLIEAGVIDGPLHLLYTEAAVVIGILYTMLPYAVVSIFTSLLTIDFDMVRAAESMGASRFGAVRTVVIPLAWPAIVSTAMLVFVISVGFYVVPVVLGGATSPFIATLIQNDMIQFFDIKSAAVAALVLIALSMAAVGMTILTVGLDQVNKSAGAS